MDKTIGFVGCGNMACAIINGLLKKNYMEPKKIIAYNVRDNKLLKLKDELGIGITTDIDILNEACDVIFLCVKPNIIESVCEKLRKKLKENTLVVSIAAGVSVERLEKYLAGHKKIIRVMPNLSISVGEGMSMVCENEYAQEEDIKLIKDIFDVLGKAVVLEEKYIDAFSSVASCSPAFVFMLIEAMADAGVLLGLKRDVSYTVASQAVLGSSKLVLDTGEHPGILKDKICSPAGTTIEGVTYLEKNAFRGNIIEALRKCEEKNKKL